MLINLDEYTGNDKQIHSSLALLKYIHDSTHDKEIVKLFKNINNIEDTLRWEEV